MPHPLCEADPSVFDEVVVDRQAKVRVGTAWYSARATGVDLGNWDWLSFR